MSDKFTFLGLAQLLAAIVGIFFGAATLFLLFFVLELTFLDWWFGR